MKDYKQKIEDLIEDCNLVIKDTLMFPENLGGQFKLKLGDNFCCLIFEEGDNSHLIFTSVSKSEPNDDINLQSFYNKCYWSIFRSLFLTIDHVIPADEINSISGMAFLNFSTLAFEGLKKLNSNK